MFYFNCNYITEYKYFIAVAKRLTKIDIIFVSVSSNSVRGAGRAGGAIFADVVTELKM